MTMIMKLTMRRPLNFVLKLNSDCCDDNNDDSNGANISNVDGSDMMMQ